MYYHKTLARKLFSLSFFLSLPFFLLSCSSKVEDVSQKISGTPVQIINPVLVNMSNYILLNGNTIFLKKEIIRSTFDGFITKVFKNVGDPIKSGDILFQLKTKELSGNDNLNLKLGDHIFQGTVFIKAGSNGILNELNFQEVDYVTAGEQIAIESNPSSLRIRLNVPYEDILKVKIGSMCQISLPDNVVLPGIVEKSVPSVDISTQTQTFFIKLIHTENIPENLNVIIKIPFMNFKNAVALPKSAIMTNVTQDSFWVMKLINDTTAIKVDIKKGIENDSLTQIISPKFGMQDRILANGAYGLPDTAEVEITK